MALKFQPPNIQRAPTTGEAVAAGLGPSIQGLPQIYMQAKLARMEQEIKMRQLESMLREEQSKYGTGEPAPTIQPSPLSLLNANPLGEPVDPAQPGPRVSRPAQPTGFGIMEDAGSTLTGGLSPESPESEMRRIGSVGFNALTDRMKATATKADAEGNKDDKSFGQGHQLRTQYLSKTKDFSTIRDARQRITDSASDPSGAGDLALIFNYMKILDPGSTVREGEFANAQNSAGLDERTRALYNRVINGERLSEAQRGDFVGRAEKLYQGQVKLYKNDVKEFRRIAEASGLDPDLVIVDLLAGVGGSSAPSVDEDKNALAWAEANPNDPRAKLIKEKAQAALGAVGGF